MQSTRTGAEMSKDRSRFDARRPLTGQSKDRLWPCSRGDTGPCCWAGIAPAIATANVCLNGYCLSMVHMATAPVATVGIYASATVLMPDDVTSPELTRSDCFIDVIIVQSLNLFLVVVLGM